jgi:hypothetical protein
MREWAESLHWDWNAISSTMNLFLPLFIALLGFAAYDNHSRTAPSRKKAKKSLGWFKTHLSGLIWVAFVLSIFGGFANYMAASHHRLYDTDLAHYYEDRYEEKMIRHRVSAANALKEYRVKHDWLLVTNSTAGIDEVLGFLDTLGYDEQHGKISADAVHEFFFDDIDGYYRCCEAYIAKEQKSEGQTVFEYVKPLFDDVTKVESAKSSRSVSSMAWTDKDVDDWIDSESKLLKP